jgi:hypothetical protein
MDKFRRSWELFKTSLIVMGRDKRLLLFPILTTLFTALVAVLFLMPVAFQRTGFAYGTVDHWKAVGNSVYALDQAGHARAAGPVQYGIRGVRPLALGYFAVMYFVSMFCATFCNVAFYQQILAALSGQPVSITGGIQFACTKWKAILMWTLFAGLVGYVIKALEQRSGLIGQWILKLLGTAWSIACVFVIPVIITDPEASNPFAVLKKSALTLRKTWGESLIGYVGVSFGGLVILLFSLIWLGGGIALSMSLHLYWLIAVIVLTWLLAIVLWSYIMSVASQIFRCALFLYASQGTLPAPYTEEMAALAWRTKRA